MKDFIFYTMVSLLKRPLPLKIQKKKKKDRACLVHTNDKRVESKIKLPIRAGCTFQEFFPLVW